MQELRDHSFSNSISFSFYLNSTLTLDVLFLLDFVSLSLSLCFTGDHFFSQVELNRGYG